MTKKYYWLKIQEDFFRQKEIKSLRKQEKGSTYVIIYQKMLVYSLQNSNKLYFDNIEGSFEEEIALMIDEEVEDVKATLDFLKRTGLIECVNDDEFELVQVKELTGVESESTKRVRKHRENKKSESKCNSDETSCNKNVTTEKEIEKDKDIEKDTDNKCVDENLKEITKLYEQNIGPLYPANRQWFIEVSEKIPANLFEKAIEICIDKSNVTPSYLKGIIKRWTEQKIFTLDDLNAKQMELVNRKNQLKKKPARNVKVEEIDENMLKEIQLMEEKLGIN